MPELRIILLVVGVLFVAGIAAFEWWRARGQRPAAARMDGGALRDAEPAPREALPEITMVREPRTAVVDSLPVIELASTSDSGARRAFGISISQEVAVDRPQAPDAPAAPAIGRAEPYIGQGEEISAVRVVPDTVPTVTPPQITLDWPPESQRRIVTVRVLPRAEPRFAGRALRQAFNASGFWHGPLEIFHLPDEHGRVILSAAALAQPGTFDPSIMDSQRFSGLNLFAVLPGPLPERDAFEELVHAARQLAERLGGLITDQHGEELTPERIVRLRQSLGGPAAQASGA